MKTISMLAAAFVLSLSTASGQLFDSAESLSNRAVAASPRAKEQFPSLTRFAPARTISGTRRAATTVATHPRMLEQFPELARPLQAPKSSNHAAIADIENRALSASPRALEEFPWLARRGLNARSESFEIAPLK